MYTKSILFSRTDLVSFPVLTTIARRRSGIIGADSWFCKLSNHVTICINLYTMAHVQSCDDVQDQENTPNPFPP